MKKFIYKIKTGLLALTMVLFAVSAGYSQEVNIKGTITDALSGSAITGVNVVIKGTTQGTISDIDGNYSINAEVGQILSFSFISYQTTEIRITSSSTRIDVQMEEDITNLEEVVVTGLASSVKRTNLANAIGTVSAEELTGTTKSQTVDNALYGKLTGVNIKSSGGAPGGGVSVQLRGLSTVSNGNSQPLYIVDGVYINNTAVQSGISSANGAGAGTGRGLQDDIANRLADLNPEDIASIEVLKGPSAAAIYGTRANAGVIIITTKRGVKGATQITLNQEFGYNEAVNLLGFADWNLDKVVRFFGGSGQRIGDINAGNSTDWEQEIYGDKGFISSTSLTVKGGGEKTTFYVNGSLRDEDGIIENSGFRRASIRANVDHQISKKIKISSNTNYVNSETDRSWNGNQNGTGASFGYAISFTPPYADLGRREDGSFPNNPFFSENPLSLRERGVNRTDINRFIQAINLDVNLWQNTNSLLKFSIQGGLDYLNGNTFVYLPEILQHQANAVNPGDVIQGKSDQLNTNLQAFLTYNTNVNSLNLNTQIGFVKLTEDRESQIIRGQGLNNGQTNANTADIRTIFLQNDLEVRDFGFIAQEEINWEDKIIGTLGIRFDKSTLNLDQDEFYAFPKASVAVNLANFDFWNIDDINQLKLRAAYGETGGLPNFGTTFTQLNNVFLGTSGGTTLSTNTVSDDLQPERASEIEIGADISFLNNRGLIEFTYYKKKVEDLIEFLVPANSTGINQITFNAGDLENTGIELALSGSPIKTADFEWFGRVNYWKNDTEITRWNIPAKTRGGFGATLGTYELAPGISPTTIVGTPALTDENGDPTGRFTVYGDAQPDFQVSIQNQLSYKNFTFSFLFHHSKGNDNINLSEFLWDLGGTSPDWDDTDLYANQPETIADADGAQVPNPLFRDDNGDGRNDLTNGQGRPADRNANGPGVYVQDASFWKLREVGLYYTVPKTALQNLLGGYVKGAKVGVSGNHLFIWSDYRSYDPEVSQFTQDPVASSVEVTPFPSARRVMFHLTVDF